MLNVLKFLVALVVALLAMVAFRALVFTICTVDGQGLEPEFTVGDHVLVNRWSYGLRTGGGEGGLFGYGRLCRQTPERGDIMAFNDNGDNTLIGRCAALPGDTVRATDGRRVIVPGLKTCAHNDYYYVEPVNKASGSRPVFIAEHDIIGRVVMVVYNRQPNNRPWQGFRHDRLLLLK